MIFKYLKLPMLKYHILELKIFKNLNILGFTMKFVIEHMEPRLYKWSEIEYKNISKIIGKRNLIFTNLTQVQIKKLSKFGVCKRNNVKDLNLEKAAILDPSARKRFSFKDSKKFNYLIFGGILGDNPRKFRTRELVKKLKLPTRNLGKKQMPTDTAVYVTKLICNGTKLNKIKFKNGISVKINENLSVGLPFRYLIARGKVFISGEILKLLKKSNLP